MRRGGKVGRALRPGAVAKRRCGARVPSLDAPARHECGVQGCGVRNGLGTPARAVECGRLGTDCASSAPPPCPGSSEVEARGQEVAARGQRGAQRLGLGAHPSVAQASVELVQPLRFPGAWQGCEPPRNRTQGRGTGHPRVKPGAWWLRDGVLWGFGRRGPHGELGSPGRVCEAGDCAGAVGGFGPVKEKPERPRRSWKGKRRRIRGFGGVCGETSG